MCRKTIWSAWSPWRSIGRPLAPSVNGGVAISREPIGAPAGVGEPGLNWNRTRSEPGTPRICMPVRRSEGSWPVCGVRSHETAAADATGVAAGTTVAVGADGEAVAAAEGADDGAAIDGDALGAVGPHAAIDNARIARVTMGRRRVALLKRSSEDWEMSGRTRRSGRAPVRRGSSPAVPLPTAL